MNGRKFLDEGSKSPLDHGGRGNAVSAQEQAVLDAIRATPYGSVEVVLHQSRIVQVVKTEKVKLESEPQHR
jgi:hypothetical protein